MMKIFSILVISVLLIFQSCSTKSFKQHIKFTTPVVGFYEKVDSIVIHKMNEYNIPGLSIGLVKNDSESINRSMIKSSFNLNPSIGLGFQLDAINSKKVIGHYGGDKGFRSYLIMIPEEKIGLVLLANCDYEEDFRQEIIHPIAKLMQEIND
jgi:hypothetical protein